MILQTQHAGQADIDPTELPDIQASNNAPDVVINDAGISGLRLPFRITDVDGRWWHTVVHAEAGVSVPGRTRGTHMSRFVEFLESQRERGLALDALSELLDRLLPGLDAEIGRLTLSFPCFVRKHAPLSGMSGMLDVEARYQVAAEWENERLLAQQLTVPVMTLCPCSKAIADYGAHNQRTLVTLDIETREIHAIDRLTALVESCASSPVFAILKRADEKYVTERSYENPRFVEDVARDVYLQAAQTLGGVQRIKVRVESQESIHNHQAYAVIDAEAQGGISESELGRPANDKQMA